MGKRDDREEIVLVVGIGCRRKSAQARQYPTVRQSLPSSSVPRVMSLVVP